MRSCIGAIGSTARGSETNRLGHSVCDLSSVDPRHRVTRTVPVNCMRANAVGVRLSPTTRPTPASRVESSARRAPQRESSARGHPSPPISPFRSRWAPWGQPGAHLRPDEPHAECELGPAFNVPAQCPPWGLGRLLGGAHQARSRGVGSGFSTSLDCHRERCPRAWRHLERVPGHGAFGRLTRRRDRGRRSSRLHGCTTHHRRRLGECQTHAGQCQNHRKPDNRQSTD